VPTDGNDVKRFKNKARCLKCGDVIESTHVHDCRYCTCGAIMVDGGHDYWRCGGSLFDFERIFEERNVSKGVDPRA
jgi:hypothetical protein